jgi:hypothetical protein
MDGKTCVKQCFRWVNDIDYTDTARIEHTVDVLECIETREKPTGEITTKKYKWVANMEAWETHQLVVLRKQLRLVAIR